MFKGILKSKTFVFLIFGLVFSCITMTLITNRDRSSWEPIKEPEKYDYKNEEIKILLNENESIGSDSILELEIINNSMYTLYYVPQFITIQKKNMTHGCIWIKNVMILLLFIMVFFT